MAIYNVSYMDNVTNILDVMTGSSELLQGGDFLVGQMIMFVFFLIIMSYSLKYDINVVLIVGTFLTTILGILLLVAGMVSSIMVIAPFVALALSTVFYLWKR